MYKIWGLQSNYFLANKSFSSIRYFKVKLSLFGVKYLIIYLAKNGSNIYYNLFFIKRALLFWLSIFKLKAKIFEKGSLTGATLVQW